MRVYLICDICDKVMGQVVMETLTEGAKQDIMIKGNRKAICTLCDECYEDFALRDSVVDYLKRYMIN